MGERLDLPTIELRAQGRTIADIADELDTTTHNVSSRLSWERKRGRTVPRRQGTDEGKVRRKKIRRLYLVPGAPCQGP